MSRHHVPALNPKHAYTVVGWDPPLQTFFLIVKCHEDDEEPVYWVGTVMRELYEVEHLIKMGSYYVKLTDEMRTTLYGDKDENR